MPRLKAFAISKISFAKSFDMPMEVSACTTWSSGSVRTQVRLPNHSSDDGGDFLVVQVALSLQFLRCFL